MLILEPLRIVVKEVARGGHRLRPLELGHCLARRGPEERGREGGEERLQVRLLRGCGCGGVDGAVPQQLREELAHRLQQARVRRGQPPQQRRELRRGRAERGLVRVRVRVRVSVSVRVSVRVRVRVGG